MFGVYKEFCFRQFNMLVQNCTKAGWCSKIVSFSMLLKVFQRQSLLRIMINRPILKLINHFAS
jgi:hypothetical protein